MPGIVGAVMRRLPAPQPSKTFRTPATGDAAIDTGDTGDTQRACDHGRHPFHFFTHPAQRGHVKTIDEMLKLRLLSDEQHAQIGAWVAMARTPEAIMQMPAPLWRTLALASVLMNVDADLTQPPAMDDLSCS